MERQGIGNVFSCQKFGKLNSRYYQKYKEKTRTLGSRVKLINNVGIGSDKYDFRVQLLLRTEIPPHDSSKNARQGASEKKKFSQSRNVLAFRERKCVLSR